jgi:peptidoglycan/xylan/chitin deacetylase (PgdA/CDA1 family)
MNKSHKPAKLLFFWDYDTQWGGDRSRMPGGPKNWGHLEFVYTERLLELHAQFGVPACFAVVGAAALPGDRPYHDPAQVRRIHEAGHEVGSHTFHHEWLPGLTRHELIQTLSLSKDALEQCIGAPVTSFVPPYNQPFDYPKSWPLGPLERRHTKGQPTDLARVCEALAETGYRFCRMAYGKTHLRILRLLRFSERLLGLQRDRSTRIETRAGITCVRLNTYAGFDSLTLETLNRCAGKGGIVAVWGHPHELGSGHVENERLLVPFLQQAQRLREDGLLQMCLPRELA